MNQVTREYFSNTEIQKDQSLFRKMLDKLPAAAYTCDADGLITYFNPAAEKLWGRPLLLNNPVDRFCGSVKLFDIDGHPINHEESWMAKSLLVEMDFNEYEIILEAANGTRKNVLANVNPIHGESGTLLGIVNILVDITYQKKIEEEKRRLEMEHLHSQKFESLGVLAGGIAHDFNNLLTVIQGNANLAMMDTEKGTSLQKYLRNIEESADSAADLTKQMLAFSGKGKFFVQSMELDMLILEMVSLIKTVIPKKATFSLDLDSACIIGDITEIRQVIMNLITNAAEAIGSDPGLIEISTGEKELKKDDLYSRHFPQELTEGKYAYIKVKDTGCGMNDQTIARIFDPFYSTKFTGRGLGLAATSGIVRGHEGFIKVTSIEKEGSIFEIYIPSTVNRQDEEIAKSNNSIEKMDGELSVIVVDSDERILSFVTSALENSGFKVYSSRNGAEAISIYKNHKDDISMAVLEVTIGQMDGFEVLDILRKTNPGLPALFMSGYSQQDVFSEQKVENVHFIQKPMSLKNLVTHVKKVVQIGLSQAQH